MTEPKPITPPAIISQEQASGTILFLAEHFAYDELPDGLRFDIFRSPGFEYEAIVKDADGTPILTERIDLRDTINHWVSDLVNRARESRA